MLDQWSAHLRFHYRISPKQWSEMKLTEQDIMEWWFEYIFIKEELGEVKKD